MAQAETIPTTRRAFSKWLAAASVAAAVPLPAIAEPVETTDWAQFQLDLGYICAHVGFYDEQIAMCERASAEWKKRNPWPDAPDYASHGERVADFNNQSARESKWVVRYTNMMRQSGKGKYGTKRLAAYNKYLAECDRIAKIPARSLADIKAKTLLARYERNGGPIHQAILRDLQNI